MRTEAPTPRWRRRLPDAERPPEGRLIAQRREAMRWSQRDLGKLVGFSGVRVSQCETGTVSEGKGIKRRIKPTEATYARLARALGMNSAEWITEAETGAYTPTQRQRLRAIAAEMDLRAIAESGATPTSTREGLPVDQIVLLLRNIRGLCSDETFTQALCFPGVLPPVPPTTSARRHAS